MNKIDLRLIMLRIAALPLSMFICACSCALTCRFLLLGEPVPILAGAWWLDQATLAYIIKLSGGIAVSTAQVFGLAIYILKGDEVWLKIYRGATIISVTISVLTFQSMIQSGAINARRNTAEYTTMEAESARLVNEIDRQREEKEKIVSGLLKYDKISKGAEVGADYEKRITRDEEKLRDIQTRLANYSDSADAKDFVSASTTYDALGSDVVGFFGFPGWVGEKLAFLLSYMMLIAVALAIDMTGTRLFSFAIGDPKPMPKSAENEAENINFTGSYEYQPFETVNRKEPLSTSDYDVHNSLDDYETSNEPHANRSTPYSTEIEPQDDMQETAIAETQNTDRVGNEPHMNRKEPYGTSVEPQDDGKKVVAAYREAKSYNGALRLLGIGKNPSTLEELKNTLDRWNIEHGNKKPAAGLRLVVSN